MLKLMASNSRLARVGRSEQLHHQLVGLKTQLSDEGMGTVVEAIFGALYVDSGRDMGIINTAFKTLGLHRPDAHSPLIKATGGAPAALDEILRNGASEESSRRGIMSSSSVEPSHEVTNDQASSTPVLVAVENRKSPKDRVIRRIFSRVQGEPQDRYDLPSDIVSLPSTDEVSSTANVQHDLEQHASFSAARPGFELTQGELAEGENDYVIYAPWSIDTAIVRDGTMQPGERREPGEHNGSAIDAVDLTFEKHLVHHSHLFGPTRGTAVQELAMLPYDPRQHYEPGTSPLGVSERRQSRRYLAYLVKHTYPRLAASVPLQFTSHQYRQFLKTHGLPAGTGWTRDNQSERRSLAASSTKGADSLLYSFSTGQIADHTTGHRCEGR